MTEYIWNPWHGCKKYSEGCANCYVYRRDGSVGRDASVVRKNSDFYAPVKKNRSGEYKIPSGALVFASMTSDFFLQEADEWRAEAWEMIRTRRDLDFLIITKRILRFNDCIPDDWGDGYENVQIACTVENQQRAKERLPFFNELKIKKKSIVCEPLLSEINLAGLLSPKMLQVIVGGESGNEARVCDYNWILGIRDECVKARVPFYFKQTGARFLKDGVLYTIKRPLQHIQARKANIDTL